MCISAFLGCQSSFLLLARLNLLCCRFQYKFLLIDWFKSVFHAFLSLCLQCAVRFVWPSSAQRACQNTQHCDYTTGIWKFKSTSQKKLPNWNQTHCQGGRLREILTLHERCWLGRKFLGVPATSVPCVFYVFHFSKGFCRGYSGTRVPGSRVRGIKHVLIAGPGTRLFRLSQCTSY